MRHTIKTINYSKLLIMLIAIILIGMIVNTWFFYKDTKDTILRYLNDNNSIVIKDLTNQYMSKKESVEDFAHSLVRISHEKMTESLLEQKELSFGFDHLTIFNVDDQRIKDYIGEGSLFENYIRDDFDQFVQGTKHFITEDNVFCLSTPVIVNGSVRQIIMGSIHFDEISVQNTHNVMTLLVDTTSNRILSSQRGESCTLEKYDIDNVLQQFQNHDYDGIYMNNEYIAVASMIEGTSFVSLSMMSYDDWMPLLDVYVLGYGLLIVLVLIVLVFGIYQLRKETKRQEKVFFTDQLTQGLNRNGFISKGNDLLKKYESKNYYVLCLDISEFRYINESWGEQAGNITLLFVYRVLQGMIKRDKELVCRSNIDRFLLLVQEDDEDVIHQRIEEMIGRMNSMIHRQFLEYNIQFTIGACCLTLAEDIASAIGNAVSVSKGAYLKDKCVFYNQEMIDKKVTDAELNNIFYDSLNNHDFVVYLQPKVSHKGECQGEALVRWEHPQKGMIYPDQFISLFEQNGKIVDLDLYVFEEVCRCLSQWMKQGRDCASISVNISRYSIMNDGENIYLKYKKIKEKYDIPDDLIEIELTETVLLNGNHISVVKKIVDGFKSCGIKVALDDFGFAYSSLGILKSLDVDTIKLDQTFVRDTNPKSEKIIKSMIQLAHNLDISVVAEGVEKPEQAYMLFQSHCDYIQGYYFSKPLPVEEFEKWRDVYINGLK